MPQVSTSHQPQGRVCPPLPRPPVPTRGGPLGGSSQGLGRSAAPVLRAGGAGSASGEQGTVINSPNSPNSWRPSEPSGTEPSACFQVTVPEVRGPAPTRGNQGRGERELAKRRAHRRACTGLTLLSSLGSPATPATCYGGSRSIYGGAAARRCAVCDPSRATRPVCTAASVRSRFSALLWLGLRDVNLSLSRFSFDLTSEQCVPRLRRREGSQCDTLGIRICFPVPTPLCSQSPPTPICGFGVSRVSSCKY